MRLNKYWTKTVTLFVISFSQLIKDHMELTNRAHGDGYYIEKLKAMFIERKDMQEHLQSLEAQQDTL